MNRRTKSLLATGLGGAAALVWIPQVVRMNQEAEPPREELPAEAGATLLDGVSFLSALGPPASAPEGPLAREEGSDELIDLEALERRASRLEERARPQVSGEIARLLEQMEARAQREASPAAGTHTTPETSDREDRRRLESFAEANPLTGLVRGGAESAALLGHRVVRVGDRLDAGRVHVAEIGPSWIRLTSGAEEQVVELPPFQVRSPTTSSGTSAPETAAPMLEDEAGPTSAGPISEGGR